MLTRVKGTNDSDYEDEPVLQPKGKHKTRDVEYKTLSITQLQDLVDSDISQVASIVGLEVHPSLQSIRSSAPVDPRLACRDVLARLASATADSLLSSPSCCDTSIGTTTASLRSSSTLLSSCCATPASPSSRMARWTCAHPPRSASV